MPPDTREAILDAAEAFLASQRLRDMTVRALMAPVPVSREAFYKHFSSRYELVAELLGRYTRDVAAGYDGWLYGSDPLRDLPAMFDASSYVWVRRARVLRAVVDAAPLDPDLEAVWEAFIGGFVETAAARIRADQDRGVASADLEATLAAKAMVHLSERLITQEIAGPNPPSREQVAELLTATMVGLVYTNRAATPNQTSPTSAG